MTCRMVGGAVSGCRGSPTTLTTVRPCWLQTPPRSLLHLTPTTRQHRYAAGDISGMPGPRQPGTRPETFPPTSRSALVRHEHQCFSRSSAGRRGARHTTSGGWPGRWRRSATGGRTGATVESHPRHRAGGLPPPGILGDLDARHIAHGASPTPASNRIRRACTPHSRGPQIRA